MTEIEDSLFEKHNDVIYKNILPRLDVVEKQQAEYRLQNEALKNQVEKVELSNQDLKNTVIGIANEQKAQTQKMFDHILAKDAKQDEVKGQIQINNNVAEKEKWLAKLSFKEKLILGIFMAAPTINLILNYFGLLPTK